MAIAFTTRLVAIAAVACLAALPAQQRRPLVGRVLDAAGAVVPGATATLVWSPPGGPECGATDVVTVTSDDRGRFIAKLLQQESYSAWAIATAVDGSARASPVHEGAAAGGDLELRLEHLASPRLIQVTGAEAWAALAPLRFAVAPCAANVLAFPVDANGITVPLPPLGLAFVHDAAGQVLFVQNLPRENSVDPVRILLPPPRSTQLRVVDGDGKPLAGATVHHATAPSHALHGFLAGGTLFDRPGYQTWRHAGTTAADGTVTAVAPVLPANSWSPLLVRMPGMAESVVDGKQAGRVAGAVTVTMHPAARLRLVEDGALVRAAEVLLTAGYIHQSLERVVALRPGDSGTCELQVPLGPIETMLHVRRKPDDPWQLLRLSFASGEVAQVDLAGMRRLSLQFVDENGGPARGLTGVLVAVGSQFAGQQQVVVCTDQAGRLERRIGGDAWLLVMTDGVRWRRFDIPPAGAPGLPPTIEATLACERLPATEFWVRDGNGTPLQGARIGLIAAHVHGARTAADGTFTALLQPLMQRLAERPRSDGAGRLLVPLVPNQDMSLRARITAPGRGTVEVPFALGAVLDVVVPAASAQQPGR